MQSLHHHDAREIIGVHSTSREGPIPRGKAFLECGNRIGAAFLDRAGLDRVVRYLTMHVPASRLAAHRSREPQPACGSPEYRRTILAPRSLVILRGEGYWFRLTVLMRSNTPTILKPIGLDKAFALERVALR